MSHAEWVEIIEKIASQALVVGSGLMIAYFKIAARFDKKIKEVNTHTSISVQRLNGMLSHVINSFDRPAWIKVACMKNGLEDIEFRMLELNQSYEDWFKIDKTQYIGKTDLEAGWDRKSSLEFRKNDLAVWASGEPETFIEMINGEPIRVRKIRLQTNDGTLKGIMGYISDDDHMDFNQKVLDKPKVTE